MLENPGRGLRIVGTAGGPRLSKRQQRFNKLVREVERIKETIRAWSNTLPEIHRGVAEHERLLGEYRAVNGERVRMLDRLLLERSRARALTQSERAHLRQLLCEQARDLLEVDDSPELKDIYNRHSRGDYDAEVASEEAFTAQAMRSMLEDLGLDFQGADIRTVSDLQEATVAQLEERGREAERAAQAAAERQAQRKKSTRQVAAEERREAEQARVGKALQEVYRKLAIALHPDREPDPQERARKTLLMQQINVAYEAKDLLQLLELQLRFEQPQIDEAHISGLADDRLDHYNKLLGEQVWQLKTELAGIELPWRMQLGLPPTGKLPPARVASLLRSDLKAITLQIERARRDLAELTEPARLKEWLQELIAAAARQKRDLLTRL